MFLRVMCIAMMLSVSTVARAMTLSDQLLSPSFLASQGALVATGFEDALSWTQNPAQLAAAYTPHLSVGTFLIYPRLNPKPAEKSARGASVIGFNAPRVFTGVFGFALSMPLGQNVWVDTGSRESSALFGLSRITAFSLALGWAKELGDGWSAGLQIPILFRSNTITDIYLVEDDPWARARSGVMPYFGWHLGVKKTFSPDSHLAISYREEQASKIEFAVKGEVDFAGAGLPLDAAGISEILFEPRRVDLRYQLKVSDWHLGFFTRWSHWMSAPKLGLVIDSENPEMSTNPSRIRWQNQIEAATSVARTWGRWTPVGSYRYRTKAVKSSDDYLDYNEHIIAGGANVEVLHEQLWLASAVRWHKLVGGGDLVSVLASLDWAL